MELPDGFKASFDPLYRKAQTPVALRSPPQADDEDSKIMVGGLVPQRLAVTDFRHFVPPVGEISVIVYNLPIVFRAKRFGVRLLATADNGED